MRAGLYVRLTVTDTGQGMDEETRSRVFEPFFTTKARGRGTGLGLSTVYGILDQSGGYVRVRSDLGKGTSFELYLPQIDGPPDGPDTHSISETTGAGETLLLVEDEETVLKFARVVLERAGYRVIAAKNGDDALRSVREYPGPIHLLVTDVVMPGMSGHVLFESLQPLRPDLPVLYTSGYTDDAIVHHGVLDPGTHLLEKPYSQSSLLGSVRNVLASRQATNSFAKQDGSR